MYYESDIPKDKREQFIIDKAAEWIALNNNLKSSEEDKTINNVFCVVHFDYCYQNGYEHSPFPNRILNKTAKYLVLFSTIIIEKEIIIHQGGVIISLDSQDKKDILQSFYFEDNRFNAEIKNRFNFQFKE